MNWRVKAAIQNLAARLPASLANPAYYWLQRRLGGMRRVDPTDRIEGAIEFCKLLEQTGSSVVDGRFLEIGTGWRVNVPLTLWLCGARSIATVDLNRYLRPELVRLDVRFIREHRAQVEAHIGQRLNPARLDQLAQFDGEPFRIDDLMHRCNIQYLAPCDAARLPFADESLDFEVSFMVLEHIPVAALESIHREAFRVLRPGGKVVHRIDLSDHFFHRDRSISPLNFLQFDEQSWRKLANNRFMYMNRLRIDDHLRIFEKAGLRVILCRRVEDPLGLAQLRDPRFQVDTIFRDKSVSDLATTEAWVVAEKP